MWRLGLIPTDGPKLAVLWLDFGPEVICGGPGSICVMIHTVRAWSGGDLNFRDEALGLRQLER